MAFALWTGRTYRARPHRRKTLYRDGALQWVFSVSQCAPRHENPISFR